MLSRRKFLCGAATLPAAVLSGCETACTPPPYPAGMVGVHRPTLGEVRRCAEEAEKLRIVLPAEAPSIIADYGSRLGANRLLRDLAHEGIDIIGADGMPVIAAMDGTVIRTDPGGRSDGGTFLLLHHGRNSGGEWLTVYAHLSRLLVQPGATVSRGQVLGLIGRTGRAMGVPHVHYGVYGGPGFRPLAWQPLSHHLNPHLIWHDGPGQVTLFRPGMTYPNRFGATYPVPGSRELPYFERSLRSS